MPNSSREDWEESVTVLSAYFFFPKTLFQCYRLVLCVPILHLSNRHVRLIKNYGYSPAAILKHIGSELSPLLPQNRPWNTLPLSIKRCKAAESFKSTFKTYLFRDFFELQESLIITFFQAFLWYLVFFIIHCCKALLVQ